MLRADVLRLLGKFKYMQIIWLFILKLSYRTRRRCWVSLMHFAYVKCGKLLFNCALVVIVEFVS